MSFKSYSKIGLYPVVDSSAWVEKLLPLGVKTIQLRIKEPSEPLDEEIKKSIALANHYSAVLFVNDYWELALRYGAQAVHLGQGDLDTADVVMIRRSGLFLGVSTHCLSEVERALALHPSYLACGPIYETTSKIMPFKPQGVERLKHWRRVLNVPLVAIGGINLQRIPEVLSTGVEGIAVRNAIIQAPDPQCATQKLLAAVAKGQVHV